MGLFLGTREDFNASFEIANLRERKNIILALEHHSRRQLNIPAVVCEDGTRVELSGFGPVVQLDCWIRANPVRNNI